MAMDWQEKVSPTPLHNIGVCKYVRTTAVLKLCGLTKQFEAVSQIRAINQGALQAIHCDCEI